MNNKELKLQALFELKNAFVFVPEEKYDQGTYALRQNEGCGCMMYHFDKDENGLIDSHNENNFSKIYDDILTVEEKRYLTSNELGIRYLAMMNGWPLFDEKFNKEEAIKRIDFIISLNQ